MESLEELNLEIMQCSALFFGDDVEVDAALFPATVAVGYLTENDEQDEQHINKYQSMEQIYKRMMRLCETANVVDNVMQQEQEAPYQAETMTEAGETYRVYRIAEEQIDRLAVKMLAGNRVKGLPQTVYRDGSLKVRITGMESLYEYFCKTGVQRAKEQLLKFFADMITTALSLEEYMLSLDRLLLDPREIYVSEQADRVLIPLYPHSMRCTEGCGAVPLRKSGNFAVSCQRHLQLRAVCRMTVQTLRRRHQRAPAVMKCRKMQMRMAVQRNLTNYRRMQGRVWN